MFPGLIFLEMAENFRIFIVTVFEKYQKGAGVKVGSFLVSIRPKKRLRKPIRSFHDVGNQTGCRA